MRFAKRTMALVGGGALVVAGAGAAIGVAATSGGGPPSEAFAEALSDRVGTTITPEQVEAARGDVMRERLNQAVQDGRLTREQADQILKSMQEAPKRHEAREATREAIAAFLGLPAEELHEKRHQGMTLAEIADEQGKTRAQLVDAIKKAITDGASAAGIDAPEGDELNRRAEQIADGERGRGGHGPPGARGGFGPGGFGPGGFGPGGPPPGGP